MPADRDTCADPLCKHIRLVHKLHGRCESLNGPPCRCEEFKEED